MYGVTRWHCGLIEPDRQLPARANGGTLSLVPWSAGLRCELCGDGVAVQMIPNKYELSHRAMSVSMAGCGEAISRTMRMLVRMLGWCFRRRLQAVHNARSYPLDEQVSCAVRRMGKALDAEDWFLRCNMMQGALQGLWMLGTLAVEHKGQPAWIFGMQVLVSQEAMLVCSETRVDMGGAERLEARQGGGTARVVHGSYFVQM